MRLEPHGTIADTWGYRAIASAEIAPGRIVYVHVLSLAGPSEGPDPYPFELVMLDLESMTYIDGEYTIEWDPPAFDEQQPTPTLMPLGGGRFAFFLPNSVTIVDTIVDGIPGWRVVSTSSLGGDQTHNSTVKVGDSPLGLEEFTAVDVGTHIVVLGAGPGGAGFAEVSYAGTLLTSWTLGTGEWFRSTFPTNGIYSGGDVWWPQVIETDDGTQMGVLRLHKLGGAWALDWLTNPNVMMPGWSGITQTIASGAGATVLVHAAGERIQVFMRRPSAGVPIYPAAFPGTELSTMSLMSPPTGPPGVTDDVFFGTVSAMESLKALRVTQSVSWFGRIVVASYPSGWVVAFHADGASVYRYVVEQAGGGQWLLRQRQTLPGGSSWPLRQRQNGGNTGSWPLRQRQRGV